LHYAVWFKTYKHVNSLAIFTNTFNTFVPTLYQELLVIFLLSLFAKE